MNIRAINEELAKIGYKAVKISRPKSKAARIEAWKPQTQTGRACRASMLRWAKLPPIQGIRAYMVRGEDGQMYAEWMDGFEAAKAYRRKQDALEMSNRHA